MCNLVLLPTSTTVAFACGLGSVSIQITYQITCNKVTLPTVPSLQLPSNLVQIPSGAGVATINAQIQPNTSPTHILPNTVMSPPAGLTTVTLNARPILPQQQQQQQQRKINPGKNFVSTWEVQPGWRIHWLHVRFHFLASFRHWV